MHHARQPSHRQVRLRQLGVVLLAVSLLPSGNTNTVSRVVTQPALTQFSALANQTFIVALYEIKPWVFFDCDYETAVQEWNGAHPTNPKQETPLTSNPVQPPKTCKRQNECPDAPDSEPFCGITVHLAKDICRTLNCTVKFYIASENPHHWESEEAALRAIGAGSAVGTYHWADAAGGALIISSERTQIAHFTTPYYQTGFRMVTRRPAKSVDLWTFLMPFSSSLWILLLLEMVVVSAILFIIESPATTLAADGASDLVEGTVSGLLDAFYWSFTTLTSYVHKTPRTPAGKIVMMAQGFYMVVMLASYTANLASALTVSAIEPRFSGWEHGPSPVVPDNMRTVNIAIPGEGEEEDFVQVQEERWRRDFANVHEFDEIEQALDSVLCGYDDVTFHDESILLYYLNNEMVDFSKGDYTSDVCNMSQVVLPAGQNPRCALMFSGHVFNTHGYGFAFGTDDVSFIPWTQAITILKESGEIEKYFSEDQEHDYLIGASGLRLLEADCDDADGDSNSFKAMEFFGLTLVVGIAGAVGLMQYLIGGVLKYRNTHRAADEPVLKYINTHRAAVTPEDHRVSGHGLDPAVQAAINAGLELTKHSFEQVLKHAYEEALRKSQKISATAEQEPSIAAPAQQHPANTARALQKQLQTSSYNPPLPPSPDNTGQVRSFSGSFSTVVSELDVSPAP